MGELGHIVKYLYWSERRIESLIADNNIKLLKPTETTLKSPSIPFVPTIERKTSYVPPGRHDVARAVETALGDIAVSSWETPPPARYAKGVGSIVFSEYPKLKERGMVTAGTVSSHSRGSVAICMFGSFNNLADVVSAGGSSQVGWTSSAAASMFDFLQSQKVPDSAPLDSELDVAIEALKEVFRHGLLGRLTQTHPRGLGCAYGLLHEVGEWLMEVYLDIEVDPREFKNALGFTPWGQARVVVGAPLWIRTPRPTALETFGRRDYRTVEREGESPWSWQRGKPE